MKKSIGFILALALAQRIQAKEVGLSMAYTNALGEQLPFDIYAKKSWKPDSRSKYVKLHLYFDEPMMVDHIEIDTCGKNLNTNLKPFLSLFVNFDQWILQNKTENGEGGMPGANWAEVSDGKITLPVTEYDPPVEVRSLTFNFEGNQDIPVCDIKIFDAEKKPYQIKVPQVIQGSASASSTLEPSDAYDVVYLFDSRFEYGWASNKKAKDVDLQFAFKDKQRIEKIRIWNGYQRSPVHCYSNSRAKKIRIEGDGGYKATIEVKDELGSQTISLPKSFEGKNLKFIIEDSFKGKTYEDLVISELRFFNGKDWFLLDPSKKLAEVREKNRAAYSKAKVEPLLHDSYSSVVNEKDPFYSTMRLRPDGGFYFSGSYPDKKEEEATNAFFSLGSYEVKETDPKKGMLVRLFGLFYETKEYGDCNGCGRDCNSKTPKNQKIFQEEVWIRPGDKGKFVLETKGKGKKLKFKELVYEQESKK